MWTLLAIAVGVWTAFGLLVWRHEMRRKNFNEPEQFRGVHMIPPWRKYSGRR
jgi:hypothetical protein